MAPARGTGKKKNRNYAQRRESTAHAGYGGAMHVQRAAAREDLDADSAFGGLLSFPPAPISEEEEAALQIQAVARGRITRRTMAMGPAFNRQTPSPDIGDYDEYGSGGGDPYGGGSQIRSLFTTGNRPNSPNSKTGLQPQPGKPSSQVSPEWRSIQEEVANGGRRRDRWYRLVRVSTMRMARMKVMLDSAIANNYNSFKGYRWILDPVSSTVLHHNNFAQVIALVYTAIFTPFEVALLGGQDGFWTPHGMLLSRVWLNTIVDVIFLVDMALQVVTPYRRSEDNRWERTHHKIVKRYLRTWFVPDFLAVFPWYVLNLDTMRIIRLIRLVKIMKSAKYADEIQVAYNVSYLHMQLVKFIFIFLITSHWMSCAWCFVATYAKRNGGRNADGDDGEIYDKTWLDALADGKLSGDIYTDSVMDQYLASCHFAIMTITSVGYGDIAPQNRAEYVVAILLQSIGSIVYTYLMAMFLSLVAVVDEEPWSHARRMDTLNLMMQRAKVSEEDRTSFRQFFIHARRTIARLADRDVFDLMSPSLQAQLVENQYLPTLRKIAYFKNVSDPFLVDVCKVIKPMMLAPKELLSQPATLYVIDKGLVVFQGRVQGAGAFIGGDFMLSNPELRPMTFPTVLTFVEVLTLHRLELEEVMMRFPNDAKYVRTGVVWGALKQHLMKVGRESLMKKGDSRRKMIYASLKLGGGSRRASAMGGGLGPGSIDVLRVKAASQAGEDIDQREKQAMSQINESQYSEDSLRSDPIVASRTKAKQNAEQLMTDVSLLVVKTNKLEQKLSWICDALEKQMGKNEDDGGAGKDGGGGGGGGGGSPRVLSVGSEANL